MLFTHLSEMSKKNYKLVILTLVVKWYLLLWSNDAESSRKENLFHSFTPKLFNTFTRASRAMHTMFSDVRVRLVLSEFYVRNFEKSCLSDARVNLISTDIFLQLFFRAWFTYYERMKEQNRRKMQAGRMKRKGKKREKEGKKKNRRKNTEEEGRW